MARPSRNQRTNAPISRATKTPSPSENVVDAVSNFLPLQKTQSSELITDNHILDSLKASELPESPTLTQDSSPSESSGPPSDPPTPQPAGFDFATVNDINDIQLPNGSFDITQDQNEKQSNKVTDSQVQHSLPHHFPQQPGSTHAQTTDKDHTTVDNTKPLSPLQVQPKTEQQSQDKSEDDRPHRTDGPCVHFDDEGPITVYHHAEVPGINPSASWTSDTEFILQNLRSCNEVLERIRLIDSATPTYFDGQNQPGEVPVTTFFDAFPSDTVSYRKVLKISAHPGDNKLRNLALTVAKKYQHSNKYIRLASDISITAKFFMCGKVMSCEFGSEGRGKQINIAPQACMFQRIASNLAAIFKINAIGMYSYKSGITFSTTLKPIETSTKQNSNASLLRGSPKKKMRFNSNSPSVLQHDDAIPVYDGRGLDFEPQNYEQLPKFTESIPESACAMVIFTANSNKATKDFLERTNMFDYPTFASLNLLAVVYMLPPDKNQRKAMVKEPDDFIGVDYSSHPN